MKSHTIHLSGIIFIILVCFLHTTEAIEEVTMQKIKAGVFISPPFVMEEADGSFSGMAIDLWEMVSNQLNMVTEYVEYNSLESLMNATQNGEVEIAVTNLTVTYDRAQKIKFTFPWYNGGLRIMVKSDKKGSLWNEMKQNGQIQSYFWIILLIILFTVLMTLFYRHKDPQFPKEWKEGLALSLYNLMVAVRSGSIKVKFLGWIGHLITVVWMIFGIGIVAYVTSTITSSMTKVSLTSDITTLADLPGKLVGVERGGIEEIYLGSLGIQTIPYDNIMHAAEGLLKDEVKAVVGDAPVLEYWVHTNREKKLKVTGSLFHPDKYAFASNKVHSTLTDSITVELIKLYDIGKIKEVKDKYLGSMPEGM